ncbi:MAG TPA: SGNH/GDSL hydrolase family protein [Pseudolysinimonas sp.]
MSRLPAILLAPIALAQGRGLQRRTPRMPPAEPRTGGSRAADALRLLVLGDSTAVGTGVEQMADALAGQLARRLPESVAWRAVGENGATSSEVRERHLPEALTEPADIAVVLVGWNDALQLKSAARYGEHLGALLDGLRDRNPGARLVVVGPPVFGAFVTLPQPLRAVLGSHARGIAKVAARVAAARGIPLVPGFDGVHVGADGFHPDATGYAGLADRVAAALG